MRQRIEIQRVGVDHLQPAGIGRGDLGQGGQAAASFSTARTRARALGQKPAGQPAGAGADLQHVAAASDRPPAARSWRSGSGPAESSDPSISCAESPCASITSRSGGRCRSRSSGFIVLSNIDRPKRARISCRGHPRGHPRAAIRRGRVGHAFARDVKRGAVIGRGADEGQAKGDVDAPVEIQRLDRDQRLIVIHADRRVIAAARARRGTWCRRTAGRQGRSPRRAARSSSGRDQVDFFAAHRAAFAGMGVEARHGEARCAQCRNRGCSPSRVMRIVSRPASSAVSAPGTSAQRDVDRHRHHAQVVRRPASSPPAPPPPDAARYSVWPG